MKQRNRSEWNRLNIEVWGCLTFESMSPDFFKDSRDGKKGCWVNMVILMAVKAVLRIEDSESNCKVQPLIMSKVALLLSTIVKGWQTYTCYVNYS